MNHFGLKTNIINYFTALDDFHWRGSWNKTADNQTTRGLGGKKTLKGMYG